MLRSPRDVKDLLVSLSDWVNEHKNVVLLVSHQLFTFHDSKKSSICIPSSPETTSGESATGKRGSSCAHRTGHSGKQEDYCQFEEIFAYSKY